MELHARPHGVALVRPLGRAILAAAAGAACIVLGGGVHWVLELVGAAALGLASLLALSTVVEWERTDVLLTDDVLRVRWGILRRRSTEIRLEPSSPVQLEQGIGGRLLGYGTLVAGGIEVPYVPLASVRPGRP